VTVGSLLAEQVRLGALNRVLQVPHGRNGNMLTRLRKPLECDLLVDTHHASPVCFCVPDRVRGRAGVVDLGWRRTLGFTACVWPVAMLAELSSTRTGFPFGLYQYTGLTRGQELFIADVPFIDSLSFVFLAYASFCLARITLAGRGAPRWSMALTAGVLMMALDIVIDPLAVRGDRWFLGPLFAYINARPLLSGCRSRTSWVGHRGRDGGRPCSWP